MRTNLKLVEEFPEPEVPVSETDNEQSYKTVIQHQCMVSQGPRQYSEEHIRQQQLCI